MTGFSVKHFLDYNWNVRTLLVIQLPKPTFYSKVNNRDITHARCYHIADRLSFSYIKKHIVRTNI